MASLASSISEKPTRWVIAIDGTWGDRIRGSTVVADLGDMICNKHHHTIYNKGVGTSLVKIGRLVGGATGLGFDAQVKEAYRHLIGNWVEGDEIIIIGYSRGNIQNRSSFIESLNPITGAFAAVHLAGLISCIGIPQKDPKISAETLYKRYKHGYLDQTKHRWTSIQEFKCHESVPIKALALFDTVGTLGIPKTGMLNFLNFVPGRPYMKGMQQPKCIKRVENIFHALALDEIRAPYAPTLIRLPSASSCNLEQVWFTGSHHDLGKDDPRTGGLVDKPLAWMVSKLASIGVAFRKGRLQERFSGYDRIVTNPDAELITDPTEWVGEDVQQTYKGWIKLLGYQTREPGRYGDSDTKTNEQIHMSVRVRGHGATERSRPVPGLRYVNAPGGTAQWTSQGAWSSNRSRKEASGHGNMVLLPEARLDPFEAELQCLAVPE
ncbi:hypothetical protein MMC30_005335 [Trapelia coarctata]|nr:hypothetical protein [Trapelia coarctata]